MLYAESMQLSSDILFDYYSIIHAVENLNEKEQV